MNGEPHSDLSVIVLAPDADAAALLARATTAWLVFTEPDVRAASDWLDRLRDAMRRWPDDGIFGGRVDVTFQDGDPGIGPRIARALGRYAPRGDEGPTAEPPAPANVAVRAALLHGVTPRNADDLLDHLMRLYRGGEQFIHVPDAVVIRELAVHPSARAHLRGRVRAAGRARARLYPDPGNWPLFGVPAASYVKLALTAVRRVVALARPGRDLDASLDFELVQAEVLERARRTRSRAPAPAFPTGRAFRSALRRLGLAGIVVTPIKALLRPIAQWEDVHFFETDIDGAARPPREAGVEVRVFHGPAAGPDARRAITRMEMTGPAEIERRLGRGDAVAVAFVDGRPVGYEWAAYRDSIVEEFDSRIVVRSDEVLSYDAYVMPEMRGHRIMHLLDAAQLEQARELGRTRQIMYVKSTNRASLRSLAAAGKRRTFRFTRVVVPALGIDRISVSEATQRDRFVRL